MDEKHIKDEFNRIQITAQLTRYREMISQYEIGLAHRRQRVEDALYELGSLDERLGGKK